MSGREGSLSPLAVLQSRRDVFSQGWGLQVPEGRQHGGLSKAALWAQIMALPRPPVVEDEGAGGGCFRRTLTPLRKSPPSWPSRCPRPPCVLGPASRVPLVSASPVRVPALCSFCPGCSVLFSVFEWETSSRGSKFEVRGLVHNERSPTPSPSYPVPCRRATSVSGVQVSPQTRHTQTTLCVCTCVCMRVCTPAGLCVGLSLPVLHVPNTPFASFFHLAADFKGLIGYKYLPPFCNCLF